MQDELSVAQKFFRRDGCTKPNERGNLSCDKETMDLFIRQIFGDRAPLRCHRPHWKYGWIFGDILAIHTTDMASYGYPTSAF